MMRTNPAKKLRMVAALAGLDAVAIAGCSSSAASSTSSAKNPTASPNPQWGLLWVDGSTAFAGLDQQGLLLKGFEPNVPFNSLGTQNVPADKSEWPGDQPDQRTNAGLTTARS
ncbi:MAG: hypothetical protein ACYCO9_09595 [Streptosporangiaceae bacterium]